MLTRRCVPRHAGAFACRSRRVSSPTGTRVTRRGESGAQEHGGGGVGESRSQELWGGRKEGWRDEGKGASPLWFLGQEESRRVSGAAPTSSPSHWSPGLGAALSRASLLPTAKVSLHQSQWAPAHRCPAHSWAGPA